MEAAAYNNVSEIWLQNSDTLYNYAQFSCIKKLEKELGRYA